MKKYLPVLGATNNPDVFMTFPKFNLKISNGRVVLGVEKTADLWA
jgi:hypothetical protein